MSTEQENSHLIVFGNNWMSIGRCQKRKRANGRQEGKDTEEKYERSKEGGKERGSRNNNNKNLGVKMKKARKWGNDAKPPAQKSAPNAMHKIAVLWKFIVFRNCKIAST